MYSIELSERERELGYSLEDVPNPKQIHYSGQETVKAVIYRLDESNYVVKTIYPIGGYRYCHRRRKDDQWLTVCNEHDDPQEAIIRAREEAAKQF